MNSRNVVHVLGIESSCDETAAAVVSAELIFTSELIREKLEKKAGEIVAFSNKSILSNVIYSQISEHQVFKGVVPEIAARLHLEKIDIVTKKALEDAKLKLADISAVAATCGPGLIGGVVVGATFAKGLALAAQLPFIAVNHIEAHALTVRLTDDEVEFPYLLILASGGNTQICVVYSCDHFEVIGQTLDDSAGEAFDKVAKMLEVGYPGGPMVEKWAKKGDSGRFKFPKPLCSRGNMNFSFSGLKTAVKTVVEKVKSSGKGRELDDVFKADACTSFQKAIADIMEYKLNTTLKYCRDKGINPKAVVISGGVAANECIRQRLSDLCRKNTIRFTVPPISLCTDNGVMIAWMGIEKFARGQFATLEFKPRPRWGLGECITQPLHIN